VGGLKEAITVDGTIPATGVGERKDAGETSGDARRKKKSAWGSAQVIVKSRFGQENPRKSKRFPWIHLARAWLDFARFG
jgi:hypothetical protein